MAAADGLGFSTRAAVAPALITHPCISSSGFMLDILKTESWAHMGLTANIIIKDVSHIFASICKNMRILMMGQYYRELQLLLDNQSGDINMNRDTIASFYKHGLTLIPTWISNYSHYEVWDEITYLFLNFNGAVNKVWEWLSDFIPHFPGHVIIYPCGIRFIPC